MRPVCLAALVFVTCSAADRAQADEPPACVAAIAQSTTVREVASSQAAWLGRCVKIRGVSIGHLLFEKRADIDRTFTLDPSATGRALGLDWEQPRQRRSNRGRVTVVGHVGDCQEARDIAHSLDTPDVIVLVRGYCHSFDGAYVRVIEVSKR